MKNLTYRRLVAVIYILFPILLNIPYILLIVNFDYPDILRQPTEEVLVKFFQGGSGLVLTWWFFAVTGIPLLFAMVALQKILEREDTPYLSAATMFGVIAGMAQIIGLLRWVFVVPVLADSFVNAGSNEATKSAAVIAFQTVHQYGGVIIGEHIGQLFTIFWMSLVSLAVLKSKQISAWVGWFGFFASGVYLLAQFELFETVLPRIPSFGLAGLIGSLLWLSWMIFLGIYLWKDRPEAFRPK